MNLPLVLAAISVAAALSIVFCAFCRLTIMSHSTTKTAARAAIWALGSVSLVLCYSILVTGYRPDAIHATTVSAIAWFLVTGRSTWAAGVPLGYRKGAPSSCSSPQHISAR